MHYLVDWNFDEDRCRIRIGLGPENITRLRRFAIGVLKSFQKPRTIDRFNDAPTLTAFPYLILHWFLVQGCGHAFLNSYL